MTIKGLIWKSVIAGSCGTIVHFLFMYFRTRSGVLPSFQPYQAFQFALSQWVGTNVPAIVPWALSFVNGMTILGFLFAWFNRLLPGRNGAVKGIACWSKREITPPSISNHPCYGTLTNSHTFTSRGVRIPIWNRTSANGMGVLLGVSRRKRLVKIRYCPMFLLAM